ncbi:hypothetical protein UlMin_033591 [Ulmus minor]
MLMWAVLVNPLTICNWLKTFHYSTMVMVMRMRKRTMRSQPTLRLQIMIHCWVGVGVWFYLEGVGSMPQNVVSETGSTSNASFHDGFDLKLDQMFATKKLLQAKLHDVAMQGYFEYKFVKSNKTLYVVKCINENCKWRVRASKLHNFGYFSIKKYYGTHNCSLVGRNMNHRQATYKMIGQKFKSQYVGVSNSPTPKGLVGLVCENLKAGVSYWKGWKAIQYAFSLIRGSPEDSFPLLLSYLHMLKVRNPGTVTHIEVDENKKFKFLFVAHGVAIRGFLVMRKVIELDGTFLKSTCKGTLLIATCQDGYFHCYPIAWGVVDIERDESWN